MLDGAGAIGSSLGAVQQNTYPKDRVFAGMNCVPVFSPVNAEKFPLTSPCVAITHTHLCTFRIFSGSHCQFCSHPQTM